MAELYTLDDILRRFKKSRATIYRWMKRGEFPKPVKKIVGSPYWNADQLRKFLK